MQARRNSEREPILLQLLAWIPNSMAMAHKVSTDTARTWTRTTTRTPLAPANVGSLPLAPVTQDTEDHSPGHPPNILFHLHFV